jgi:hypothetical protein
LLPVSANFRRRDGLDQVIEFGAKMNSWYYWHFRQAFGLPQSPPFRTGRREPCARLDSHG